MMKYNDVMTFDFMMQVKDQHIKICEKADSLFESYIQTQKHDKWLYDHLNDAFDAGVYAVTFDSEHVIFEHSRGYFSDEDTVVMPLAFVYSEEYRDKLAAECDEKLNQLEIEQKQRIEYLNSDEYKNKIKTFYDLKKELGK